MKPNMGGIGRWLAMGASLLMIAACSLSGAGEEIQPGNGLAATRTATASVLIESETATPTAAAVLPASPTLPPDEPHAVCPPGPAEFGLQANHHFWTPTGMGDWVWQASGYLQVSLDGDGKVTNTGPQTFTGSQSGKFSSGGNSCAFEAPAEVILTLTGSCTDGVLSLEIWEDWQMGTYDWVCDDEAFKFELPANMLPPSVHKVSYPLDDPSAFTYELPFGGGSGSKTYTLLEE